VKTTPLQDVPISEIRIVNPRSRSKVRFASIVNSIDTVGLKKPITLTRRAMSDDGTRYDLVCGQGRIEAFLALGQISIPAMIIEASKEDQFVMSLVENIVRRPPSNRALVREVINLKQRGHSADEIARKLGRDVDYIQSVMHLVHSGEGFLVAAVEAERIPITIALLIASANDPAVQMALSQAYESGELRGARFKEAKRIITYHAAKRIESGRANPRPRLTGEALVREYQQRTREQQALVKRAASTKEKLLMLKSAMSALLSDEHFVTLLRAEQLQDVPEQLLEEKVG
jgi:ParB family chromosome partitioning protein